MSEQTYVYPTEEQRDRWDEHADEMGMSLSEYVASMVEAGRKKFDRSFEPDQSNRELRQQRNDIKSQLDDARERIGRLENQLYRGERGTVKQFVEDNPGTEFDKIIQHVVDTAPARVTHHIEELEGDELIIDDGRHYPVDSGGDNGD